MTSRERSGQATEGENDDEETEARAGRVQSCRACGSDKRDRIRHAADCPKMVPPCSTQATVEPNNVDPNRCWNCGDFRERCGCPKQRTTEPGTEEEYGPDGSLRYVQPPGNIDADGTRFHYLKCWTTPWHDMKSGRKPFEYRRWDRDYRVGDVLVLEEYEPNDKRHSGLIIQREVTYLLPGGTFGVPKGYCVMGVREWDYALRGPCAVPSGQTHPTCKDCFDAGVSEARKLVEAERSRLLKIIDPGPLVIERVFEPSAIRRGRMATSPVFFVNTPGWRWRFPRKKDAQRFVDAGGVCPEHVERFGCPHCIGSRRATVTGSEDT